MARTASVTDTRLMRRSQQGDRRAFRALLTRYDWRLRGLAHALLLDAGRVDAVLRLAYVKAWREVVRIDPRDDAAAWLYRVVYNACIDGLRREGSRIGAAPPTAVDAPDVPDDAPPEPAAPAPAGNGASPVPTDGRRIRLVEALSSLAPADRVAVVLVDREGFAPEAAARILGLSPDVVETRLAGARARLTHQLAADLAAPPAADDATPPGDVEAAPADDGTAPPAADDTDVPAADAAPATADDQVPPAEAVVAADDEAEPQSEEAPVRLDDIPAADPVDAKVASPRAGRGSSNGARGNGDTDGPGDGRAGEP
jgi:RNA polymerase sigma-70 factor (ECF subfamily)